MCVSVCECVCVCVCVVSVCVCVCVKGVKHLRRSVGMTVQQTTVL